MSDDAQVRKQVVTSIIRGVAAKTLMIVLPVSAALLLFALFRGGESRWWFLPGSVIFGGILGLLNFRWLAVSVERVYLRRGATPGLSNLAAIIISLIKLSLIFIVLFIVIKYQLLHVFGLVAGLSLCFLAILWEGVTVMKQVLNKGEQ